MCVWKCPFAIPFQSCVLRRRANNDTNEKNESKHYAKMLGVIDLKTESKLQCTFTITAVNSIVSVMRRIQGVGNWRGRRVSEIASNRTWTPDPNRIVSSCACSIRCAFTVYWCLGSGAVCVKASLNSKMICMHEVQTEAGRRSDDRGDGRRSSEANGTMMI